MSYVFKPLFLPIFLILVLFSCTPSPESSSSSAYRSPDDLGLPFNNSLLPAGTPMVIPHWVMEQYATNGQNYGDPLNFLILNYGKTGLIPNNPNQHSYYIPLQVQDRPKKSYKKKSRDRRGSRRHRRSSWRSRPSRDTTVMVDVLKLQIQKNTGTGKASAPAQEQPTTTTIEPKPSTPTTSPSQPQPQPKPKPEPEPKKGSSSPSTPELTPAGASNQQADPGPSTNSLAVGKEVVLTTTEVIDKTTTPPVPAKKDPVKLRQPTPPTPADTTAPADITAPADTTAPAEAPQATCDEREQDTSAKAPCLECVEAVSEDVSNVEKFLTDLGTQTDVQIKKKIVSAVVNEFCQKCAGKDVRAFFSYMEERAKEKNVPKEILFAIMMRESNGDCNVIQKSTKCHGLFQLNPTNSTKLRACKKNELKGKTPDQLKSACSKGAYRNKSQYKTVQYPKIIKKKTKTS